MDKETFITLYLSLNEELRREVCQILGAERQVAELSEQIEQPLTERQLPV